MVNKNKKYIFCETTNELINSKHLTLKIKESLELDVIKSKKPFHYKEKKEVI